MHMHYTRVSMAKPNSVVLFLVIFFLANSMKEGFSIIECPEIEKEALLSFKHSVVDSSNRLSSWNTSNCCDWGGVLCSNVTGNVHQLHLKGDDWYSNSSLQGKINPSLLKLKHLKYLDLSQNAFYERIPSFMGSLTSLEYLNLSYAGFYGKIPPTVGNLSRLHTLSIESIGEVFDYADGILYSDSLEWLRGLSQLEHLHMNDVNLTNAAGNWMQVINSLPSLVDLRLRSCGLNFNFDPPSDDFNNTSLAILDLSGNKFESFPIPKWIFRQSNLFFLDLSWSNFGGLVPTSSNITKLRHINLDGNHFNSTNIPDWLYSCKDLDFVSTRYNSLQGSISNAIGNLTSLTTLDLSANQLSGEIPRGILELCKLQSLDLSENMLQGEILDMSRNMSVNFFRDLTYLVLSKNQLTGEIPINIGKLSHLETLGLSDNKLTGNLPKSIGKLSKLEDLDVGNNMMRGVVTETHFANLTKLHSLSATGNHLTLKLSPTWNPPFKVEGLGLGSWNLGAGSDIPSWIETQKSTLDELDLSNTGISGNVPTWFWKIRILNISHNHLSGKISYISGPEIGSGLIHLSSNQFSGRLPRVGNTVQEINLSNNSFFGDTSHFLCDMRNKTYRLINLHLGGNHLTGEIPDCWMKWPLLRMVNLGDNNFSGSIPNSLGTLTKLLSLNLYNNKLSGQIPVSMSNYTRLVMMDLSGNNLVGNIPTGIGANLAKLRFLILRSNKLRGTIPLSICHLDSLQILDMSHNSFSGRIPSCLNNLTAMALKRELSDYIGGELDFSSITFGNFLESASVVMKGRMTHYDTILSLVNNIDLSDNNLFGEIPEELTSLVELRSLNLSGNHLTGSIPESIGDMKQLESLDLSRNTLSGEMPNSFSVMSSLNYLNLSCNNLRGKIPEGTQLRGMDALSFVGNDLCGPPLIRKCGWDDDASEDAGNKEVDKSEIEWSYVVLSLGYAVGFSVCCTALVLKKSWRMAYFGLVDRVWDKLYVYYHIKVTKLQRQTTQTS